jgi:peptide/nickel transport system permease protein
MRNYILKRLLFMVITLVVITVVSYTMMRLAPGDPIRSQQIGNANAGVQNASRKESLGEKILREKYHLDRNPIVGYGYWIWGIVTRFDWGDSLVVNRGAPVLGIIAEHLPPTLKLEFFSIILVYACAIPIGIYSAVRRNTWSERGATVLLFVLYSLPTFWVGLLMLVFFCGDRFLNIFPVAGLSPDSYLTWGMSYWRILGETARHYVLPVVCLSYASLAGLSRFARVGILEIVSQDYIRTARAKGLPEWKVILKHVFRNSLLPLVTLFAGLLPGLIGGSIIVEYIFSINGMGSLSILALSSRDYTLMMALFTIGAVLTLLGILISDLLYAVVDPRITYE